VVLPKQFALCAGVKDKRCRGTLDGITIGMHLQKITWQSARRIQLFLVLLMTSICSDISKHLLESFNAILGIEVEPNSLFHAIGAFGSDVQGKVGSHRSRPRGPSPSPERPIIQKFNVYLAAETLGLPP
jgi:hypothetical protein